MHPKAAGQYHGTEMLFSSGLRAVKILAAAVSGKKIRPGPHHPSDRGKAHQAAVDMAAETQVSTPLRISRKIYRDMRYQNRIGRPVGLSDHSAQLLFGQSGPLELFIILHRELQPLKKNPGFISSHRINGAVMEHAHTGFFHLFEESGVIRIQFLIVFKP